MAECAQGQLPWQKTPDPLGFVRYSGSYLRHDPFLMLGEYKLIVHTIDLDLLILFVPLCLGGERS
jgi:hypothetical protein